MGRWVDGWMDRWMGNKQVGRQMLDRQMDRLVAKQMKGGMNGWVGKWIGNRQTDGQMDGEGLLIGGGCGRQRDNIQPIFQKPTQGPSLEADPERTKSLWVPPPPPGSQRSGRGQASTLSLPNPQVRLRLSEMGTFLVEPHRQGTPHRFPGELQSKGDVTGGQGVSGRARLG